MIANPLDALEHAIYSSWFVDRFHRDKTFRRNPGEPARTRPGEVIESMDIRTRDLLTKLTSDQARSIRPDVVALLVDKPGWCIHGMFYTERCKMCGR